MSGRTSRTTASSAGDEQQAELHAAIRPDQALRHALVAEIVDLDDRPELHQRPDRGLFDDPHVGQDEKAGGRGGDPLLQAQCLGAAPLTDHPVLQGALRNEADDAQRQERGQDGAVRHAQPFEGERGPAVPELLAAAHLVGLCLGHASHHPVRCCRCIGTSKGQADYKGCWRGLQVDRAHHPTAHSAHSTSACSSTVCVAFSCLSGG